LPTIQNEATLAGLGRSTAPQNAIADAQAQLMLPLFQDTLARGERSDVRREQATEAEINQLLGLAGTQRGAQSNAINALMQTGGVQRGVQQQGATSAFQDYLRRQGLAEQAQFVPFGATVPSAFGSKVTSSGGLFK
jgi:hypothetical protein